jgi:hypothetical protein
MSSMPSRDHVICELLQKQYRSFSFKDQVILKKKKLQKQMVAVHYLLRLKQMVG